MNDMNADEPSRYASLNVCKYVVDLDLEGQAEKSVVQVRSTRVLHLGVGH